MTTTAHVLVKNEVRFIWYAILSVAAHVNKILLWDTGSTDGTREVIEEILKIKSLKGKLEYKTLTDVTPEEYTNTRQEMLDATTTDWFIMVDGDEVWWEQSVQQVVETIKTRNTNIESVVVPTINLIRDIYHFQEASAGHYALAGRRGHFSLRGINRKLPGIHSAGQHGQWGWVDGNNQPVQNRDSRKIVFVDAPYLHATHLPRSATRNQEKLVPKRAKKLKYELGIPFPRDFYYPEVFFRKRPDIIPSPWQKADIKYLLRASLETPLKQLKRKFLPSPVGY